MLYFAIIKHAAKAIQAIKDFDGEDREMNDENTKIWSDLVLNAVKACGAALYHPALLDDECNVTVMTANPAFKRDRAIKGLYP